MNTQFNQKYFLIALIISIFLHLMILKNIKSDIFKNNILNSESVIEMFIISKENIQSKKFIKEIKKDEIITKPVPLKEMVSKNVEEIIQLESVTEESFIKDSETIKSKEKDTVQEINSDDKAKQVKENKNNFDLDTSKLMAQIESLDLSSEKLSNNLRIKRISSRTKDYEYRAYFESWRQKVERIGSLNYPKEASLSNFGSLRLTVSIASDGSVNKIVVDRSSGYKELDEAAKKIVMLAAPFAKFSPKMRNEIDIVNISRTWKFTDSNKLLTN